MQNSRGVSTYSTTQIKWNIIVNTQGNKIVRVHCFVIIYIRHTLFMSPLAWHRAAKTHIPFEIH